MQYPIAIEWGDEETATGIFIPDIPGAVTAGDSFELAYVSAGEVAQFQLEELAKRGEPVPMPKPVSIRRDDPEYAGMGWGMIEIDITPYLGKTESINVTLPSLVIHQIDDFVARDGSKSRSAFLAEAALEKLAGSR